MSSQEIDCTARSHVLPNVYEFGGASMVSLSAGQEYFQLGVPT